MNNLVKQLYSALAVVGLFFALGLTAKSAEAQVVFDPDPLFQEVEILPGDADPLPGTITITNQTSDARTYYLGSGVLSGAAPGAGCRGS